MITARRNRCRGPACPRSAARDTPWTSTTGAFARDGERLLDDRPTLELGVDGRGECPLEPARLRGCTRAEARQGEWNRRRCPAGDRRSAIMRHGPNRSPTVRTFSISTGLEASTVTPGRTAPESSVTTPAIEACAAAPAAVGNTTPTTRAARRNHFDRSGPAPVSDLRLQA